MRTIGHRSNILFAIAGAFGVIAALGRPWYGPSPLAADGRGLAGGELPSRMEDLFSGIGRAFSDSPGTSGWAAFQAADTLIVALALGTVLLLLLTLAPALQAHVQGLARWTSLATLGVVAAKLVDEPGGNSLSEPRHGILVALGCAAVLVASSLTVAAAPARRAPVKAYAALPPPTYAPDWSNGP